MLTIATRRSLLGGRRATPWWYVAGQTCVAAYQPIGAPSLAASYVNLAAPGTYDAAPGVAPSFDAATGWTFDVGDYLLFDEIIEVGGTNARSVIVRFDSTGEPNSNIFALTERVNGNYYAWALTPEPAVRIYGGNIVWGTGLSGDVIVAVTSHTNDYTGDFLCYIDASLASMVSVNNQQPYIVSATGKGKIGRDVISVTLHPYSGVISAVAIYSTTLSASDVAALTARMQAL